MPQQRGAPPIPPPPNGAQLDPDPEPDNYNFPSVGEGVANFGLGLAKGVASDVGGWIDAANKAGGYLSSHFGSESPLYARLHGGTVSPGPPVPTPPPQYTEPSNYQQSLGKQAQHMLDYGVAGAAVPYSMIPQGLAAAGVAGLHGGTPSEMLGTGIMGALTPLVTGGLGKAVSGIGNWAANTYPGRAIQGLVNSHIPMPPPAAPAQGAMQGAAGAATRMMRGLPPAATEAMATVPKAQYEWSGGPQPEITVHSPEAPAPPPTPKQIGAGTVPGQKAIGASPIVLSDGTTIDFEGRGQVFGQEGPLPPPKNETVTPIKPKPVRTATGQMRKGTAEDAAVQKGNIGKTVTEPTPQAPTPPKKKAK